MATLNIVRFPNWVGDLTTQNMTAAVAADAFSHVPSCRAEQNFLSLLPGEEGGGWGGR